MADNMNYVKKVVCFIDILGFKDFIKNKSILNNLGNIEEINKIIHCLETITNTNTTKPPEFIDSTDTSMLHAFREKMMFTQFSDCFILSFDYTEEDQVFHCLLQLLLTQMALPGIGFQCRGGIAVGLAVHTKDYVFGPAVIEAYNLEQKAIYPRIIASKEVIEIGVKYRSDNSARDQYKYITELLVKDTDDFYYIDYFNASHSELDDVGVEYPSFLHKLYGYIVDGLAIKDDKVHKKYLWMRGKYNMTVTKYLECLDLPHNTNIDPTIFDYYASLRTIE